MASIQGMDRDPLRAVFRTEDLERHFGAMVALGVILLLVGLAAISSAFVATMASVFVFGLIAVVGGITQIVLAFSSRGWGGVVLHLVGGVLAVVAGVLMLRAPLMGASALTLLISAWLMASGAGEIIASLSERFHHWGMSLFVGVVSTFLGIVLLASWPRASLWFIGLYIGIRFVSEGISWLSLAFAGHAAHRRLHPAM